MSWGKNRYSIDGDIVTAYTTKDEKFFMSKKDLVYLSMFTWSINKRGYLNARIDGKLRLLHRVVMQSPSHLLIDHIDGDKMNNQRSNLRKATYAENMANLGVRKDSVTQIKGVTKKGDKWRARIQHQGKQYDLGTYDSVKEASKAYKEKAIELFGDFANRA